MKYILENDMDLRINPNDIILHDDDFINDQVSIDSNGYYFGNNLTKKQELHNINLDNQFKN